MDIEKIREAVAEEHAHVVVERGGENAMVGEVNQSHGPVRSLSIDALEAMCATARAEGFRDGFQRGVADAMQQRRTAEKWAERRGETAGVVAGLTTAVEALAPLQESESYGSTLLGGIIDALGRARVEIRENGLHGEREF